MTAFIIFVFADIAFCLGLGGTALYLVYAERKYEKTPNP